MDDREAIEMMYRCLHEIRDLRKQRDHLEPQAEAYSVIRAIVGAMSHQSRGMSEDLTWVLEKRIKELQAKPAEPNDAKPC